MTEHLSDSRHGLPSQCRLADLLRQSIDSRLAGYEDLKDAERLSTDPTCRPIERRDEGLLEQARGENTLWYRGVVQRQRLRCGKRLLQQALSTMRRRFCFYETTAARECSGPAAGSV